MRAALTGGPVELKALSGQLLQLPVAENTIITPNSELVVHNQVRTPSAGQPAAQQGVRLDMLCVDACQE